MFQGTWPTFSKIEADDAVQTNGLEFLLCAKPEFRKYITVDDGTVDDGASVFSWRKTISEDREAAIMLSALRQR